MDKSAYYTNTFRRTLEPVLELLEFKRNALVYSEWSSFVETTKASIINNPEQYLGHELPEPKIIEKSIEDIFEELNVLA